MSVLVKDMDMPKCCIECSCCRHDNWNGETAHQCNVSLITFSAEDENWIYDQRPNWCPLVEIPTPHGRLIDTDAVNKAMDERIEKLKDDKSIYEASCVSTALDMFAPTVIEAEGREVTE